MPVLTLGGAYTDADNLFATLSATISDLRGEIFEGIDYQLPKERAEDLTRAVEDFWRSRPHA